MGAGCGVSPEVEGGARSTPGGAPRPGSEQDPGREPWEQATTAGARARPAASWTDTTHVFVGLPAYNEEDVLPGLLAELHAALDGLDLAHTLVVVNDGSSDDTRGVLERAAASLPLEAVHHERNQNLGGAMRSLFRRTLDFLRLGSERLGILFQFFLLQKVADHQPEKSQRCESALEETAEFGSGQGGEVPPADVLGDVYRTE